METRVCRKRNRPLHGVCIFHISEAPSRAAIRRKKRSGVFVFHLLFSSGHHFDYCRESEP